MGQLYRESQGAARRKRDAVLSLLLRDGLVVEFIQRHPEHHHDLARDLHRFPEHLLPSPFGDLPRRGHAARKVID